MLFGHHFAAIAGAGPLVGPVLAAQMGYLPGTIWIVVGVIFAGAVQDLTVMFFSMRRNGKSLGQMVREEIGIVGGIAALIAVFAIMIIILAVLALIVVNALAESPWGVFSIALTIPIALFMGVYLRRLRPGRVLEATGIGVTLLLLAIVGGGWIEDTGLGDALTLSKEWLVLALVIYGFVASVLPVWLLLTPRDYLSTFMKIGVIVLLAVSLIIARPVLQAEAVTDFAREGTGPVFAGSLFPFVFITIACGALSGFHALIASGTTPKMIAKEGQVRLIGYGGMLMESFVAISALIAACVIDQGLYFAMNSPAGATGGTAESAAAFINGLGFDTSAQTLAAAAAAVQEDTLISRTGGAPTLAVGISQIFSDAFGGGGQAFWYHFAIMFEALFILTAVDAGTRVGRFMLQDTVGNVWKKFGDLSWRPGNIIASAVVVGLWGSVLYIGVTDPLGGVNQLFPLFGIANQLLAAIALTLCHGAADQARQAALRVGDGDSAGLGPRRHHDRQLAEGLLRRSAGRLLHPGERVPRRPERRGGPGARPGPGADGPDHLQLHAQRHPAVRLRRAGAGGVRQRRRGDHAGDPRGRAADDGGTGRAVSAGRTRRAHPDGRGEAGDRRARAPGRLGHGRAAAAVTASAVVRAWRGVRWYLREFTGEARWDTYLEHCAEHGHTPMTRREFERRRSDEAEKTPISRCC